jgi:MFS family permease
LNDKGQQEIISPQLLSLRSKKFFAIFLVILIAQFIDLTIGTLSDLFVDFAVSPLGIGLFITISTIYGVGQYFILRTVKETIGQSEAKNWTHITLVRNIVTITQYVLIAIMASIVLQIIINSGYYTSLLAIGATISYGLAAILTGLLAYWFLSWFRRNRALVVLMYGLAAVMISVNAIDTILYFDITIFGTKPVVTTPDSGVFFPDLVELGFPLVADMQAISLNAYFILTWAGTILLLRHNIQRIGRLKFWVLVVTPMVFFMSFYIGFYQSINAGPTPTNEEDLSAILLPIMVIMFSGLAAIILFGLGFRSVAKSISQTNKVRDYMIITAYGFILFFTAAAATISGAGYPPFGFANVLLVGPFSYLILIGLYGSAISIAQDSKLRQSIKTSTKEELKLLDSIGISEIQRETERKVMAMTKANATTLTQQSGIEPSLTDEEIQIILSNVASEIRREKEERGSRA